MSALLKSLPHPVISAPMAGGPSTPALAAAVSGAGGLGFLAAGYLRVDRLAADLAQAGELTARPFGVNVFAPVAAPADPAAVAAYASRMRAEAARWGVEPGEPVGGDDGYLEKIALLVERAVAVVSFAFALPDAAVVRALRERGSEVWATITRPQDAVTAAELGVDALVVQGIEAGAHRGGADDTDDYALLPLLRLTAARTPVPLVAAGGICDGPALAAALAAGASAAQLGTAFLLAPEAGTPAVHRGALAGDHDAVNLWAGQAYPLTRALPAAELVGRLVAGATAASEAAWRRLNRTRLPD